MKELSIEEKAKAYDKALKEAKKWHKAFVMGQNYPASDIKVSYEWIFPELKESEDERIRKELIKFVKVNIPDEERYIAWLEKQGNEVLGQKPSWSEEDERMYRGLHNLIYVVQDCDCDSKEKLEFSVWLKSLKERVQPQSKQEWSEEEKGNVDIIVSRLEVDIEYWKSRSKRRIDEDKRVIDWLKSLKERLK